MAQKSAKSSSSHSSRTHDSLARSASAAADYKSYWPPTSEWELLYLGHCGDFFPARNLSELVHTMYADPTMPTFKGLHIDTQRFVEPLSIPARHRLVHESSHPLCTFAYAVNQKSAKRILAELSHEQEDHGTWAYDVRILEACRDMGYKCWSVNPELFHHSEEHSSEIQEVNGKPLFEEEHKRLTEDIIQRGIARGAPNIGCGVRTIAEKMGSDSLTMEVVKLASKFDGLCPVPTDEIDSLRGVIDIPGRNDLPLD
jgi:hypothetical protein